jgi:large conductance mechanosensitive channel
MVQKKIAKATNAVKAHASAAAEKTKGHGSGFVDFIREQGVIGLAVGLAIGTAAGDTVKKLVEGFINPIVQFLVGSKTLTDATWTVDLWGRTADFKWGAFVSSLITLLATALVIYILIHMLKLDKLDKKKD